MDDEEEIPIEFIRRVCDILDLNADDDGNYRPPPLSKPVVLYRPIDIAKRVLQQFKSIHAIHMAYMSHADDSKIKMEIKRLARAMWADNSLLTNAPVAKHIHAKLQQDGYKIKQSTCKTYAREVRKELGLPERRGRPQKGIRKGQSQKKRPISKK